MFKKKGMEAVANEDPGLKPDGNSNTSTNATGTHLSPAGGVSIQSNSSPDNHNIDDNNRQIQVQISLSENNNNNLTSNNNDSNHLGTDIVYSRIHDEDGNLALNLTPEEQKTEDEINRKLATFSEEQTICTPDEWEALIELQCPLPPRMYKYQEKNDKTVREVNTTARVYHQKFWIRHPKTGLIYEAITEKGEVKKHQKRLDQMRAVDEYLRAFHLTSSVQIYKRFKKAVGYLEDSTMSKSDKKKEEIAYKLIPGFTDRLSFCTIFVRAMLNAYFIYYNIDAAFRPANADNAFYFWGILLTAGAEAYLFLVAFLRSVYNSWSLVKRVWRGDTTHFQTKNMPMQIREMASISVLRFLPSGETTNRIRKRWKEWWNEIMEDYRFAIQNARKHKRTVIIRERINILFILCGPVLAILALVFKVNSVQLDLDLLFNPSKHDSVIDWFREIIVYIGFVNQIAGIRKVRLIEMQALQHFVFSGNDVKLSRHERQMMNVWWNFTVVSCVSNISDKFEYPTFDSVVFWHQLNPRKLQILLKNHDAEGEDFLTTKMKKGKRVVEVTPRQNYDENVLEFATQRSANREEKDNDRMGGPDDNDNNDDDDDGDNRQVIDTTAHTKIERNQPYPSQAGQTSTTGNHAAISVGRSETDGDA